ncbi:MAG: addiction module protein [Kiritimatiellae bacterium]|nr:addiction module protein [Kiritimatiellia bacterium]
MSPELHECEAQIMKLSHSDRAKLAVDLIASLDAVNEAENERLWLDEAKRRYEGYKAGRITARFASDVLRDARVLIS